MFIQQQQTQDAPLIYSAAPVEAEQTALPEPQTHSFDAQSASALNALNDMEQEMVDVARLRRKLPRRSFLRHTAMQWNTLQTKEWEAQFLTDTQFALLLNKLRDPAPTAWRERTLCAWLLGHAPLNEAQTAQAAAALADVLHKRHASRIRRIRANLHHIVGKTLPFAAFYALLIVAQAISTDMQYNHSAYSHAPIAAIWEIMLFAVSGFLVGCAAITTILTGLMFPWLTALNAERNNQARIVAALSLGRLRQTSSVEDLCRAALDTNANVRRASEHALLMCLPMLTPEHYGKMRSDTTSLLCNLLIKKKERLFANHHSTERLVLAILDALGKVGSGEAAKHVAPVAQDGWTDAVRERAAGVLPILEERRRQASDPHLLLRASHLPPDNGGRLVRPAMDTCADAPEQLLRASASQ